MSTSVISDQVHASKAWALVHDAHRDRVMVRVYESLGAYPRTGWIFSIGNDDFSILTVSGDALDFEFEKNPIVEVDT